jgi:adenylate cyclase class 2
MIEAEVKVPVNNLALVRKLLKKSGAVRVGKAEEMDVYFSHPSRNFMLTDEALRIRRVSHGEGSITYKGPKFRPRTKTRIEINIPVSDPDSLEGMLKSLGFSPLIKIVKKREKWRIGNVNVYLDEVRSLGKFVELEATVNDALNLDHVEKRLFSILGQLGLDPNLSTRKSYLELMMNKTP